ncbi:MAG: coproporphyrinogen III oxidase [Parcubacteria group bacterium ADurb.Bin316]|nr:MAG: coproporphyrinogen III oxidase [Parcubacteria group bacterium ADurb.Bin316]HOZ55663.1 tRNA uridine(34) 5-carboxymethylaminomethyl modification radical SAM/GNAT enzyme Elp3 [bacterium]
MISSKNTKNKQRAIAELLRAKIKTRNDLMLVKRKIAKKYGIKIFLNSEILSYYQNQVKKQLRQPNNDLLRILRKRSIRTLSGIAPVAVLTMPYPCPGKCTYCPTEKNVPQSYLSNEPAVMRAIRCEFNPYVQVQDRLRALVNNGHEPTKIELIVIGGTWSYLPREYKYWYVWQCFEAANEFNKIQKSKFKSQNYNSKLKIKKLKRELLKEQKKNEKAKYKIIGITLETRPDYINEKELWQMRELGCTRLEIGVQAIDDKILKLNKRGSNVTDITRATKLLKDFGFKVTYHIMPGLPGSTPAKDFKMYQQLFADERFQPDQIKFYPTVVTKGSELYKWWKQGEYKPYANKRLEELIIKCKQVTPEYVRIIRLIRDIPSESIIAGNMITNLRQVMKDRGVECRCIRCREAREKRLKVAKLKVESYKASGGEEYFISYNSKDGKTLYGFCRLRLPKNNLSFRSSQSDERNPLKSETESKRSLALLEMKKTALIRELHVYGELMPVGSKKKTQHSGLGRKLLSEAEKIAKKNGYKKMVVISGVGVRDYYRKFGYDLENSYMVKKLL